MKRAISQLLNATESCRVPSLPLVVILLGIACPPAVFSQSVVAVLGSAETSLPTRNVQSRFFVSNADSAQEALKNTAISAAGQQATGAVAGIAGGKLLTIPVVGGLPVQGAMAAVSIFHKKTIKGFTVDYLLGLTSETVIGAASSFSIDTVQSRLQSAGVQVSKPTLVRLQPQGKDFARIVRTIHLSYKEGGNPLNAEILGAEQTLVSCRIDEPGGDKLTMTPIQALEPGEYAVVLPTRSVGPGVEAKETLALAWDFRIQ